MILTEYRKAKLKDIAYAALFISIGTAIGVISLVLFYAFHIAIFGFNLGLIFSPIIAGISETYLAKRYYGKTTGAVSAFILFFITVFYGFIYINNSLGLNLITVGSAAVILQAAFPIFINYFLVVVLLGVLSYTLGIFKKFIDYIHISLKKLYYKLRGKEYVEETSEMDYNQDMKRVDVNNLGILFLTIDSIQNENIKKFNGVFEGEILIQTKKSLTENKKIKDTEVLIKNLEKAKEQAIINLSNNAKNAGCNSILDLEIQYDTLSTLKEDNIHIVARGTGVELSK
ncbi:hypothetical protein SDC9_33948 [bioreactor metagenome]|uniref:Uncharacterized protein n=1 Tax=bioreactor metagenome TaxID=1076179 RepID=A0A644VA64_9ZZZZ|nr:heavy metal-binding domain-containing protein [Methanobrevibacter sp.]MEA4957757.1 heavy metal-binding domain-containing protein [Methanobrevibacter sp.]